MGDGLRNVFQFFSAGSRWERRMRLVSFSFSQPGEERGFLGFASAKRDPAGEMRKGKTCGEGEKEREIFGDGKNARWRISSGD